jgi:SAM-dependent methyltransferase
MDPKERFTARTDDYVKYRPTYPAGVLETLKTKFGFEPSHAVADIGSGTGISTELFLKNGNQVFAVEPNEAMRNTAEAFLKKYPNFRSVNGTAEATTLPNASVNLIVAAQAFHWFNPEPTRNEFKRILKPGGQCAVLFNDRRVQGTPFAEAYEHLLRNLGSDYEIVKHKNVTEKRHRAFLGAYREFTFPNEQRFDFEGLLGRLRSSSYSPKEGEPFDTMVKSLRKIFDENQKGGLVVMEYTTQLFVGPLA